MLILKLEKRKLYRQRYHRDYKGEMCTLFRPIALLDICPIGMWPIWLIFPNPGLLILINSALIPIFCCWINDENFWVVIGGDWSPWVAMFCWNGDGDWWIDDPGDCCWTYLLGLFICTDPLVVDAGGVTFFCKTIETFKIQFIDNSRYLVNN